MAHHSTPKGHVVIQLTVCVSYIYFFSIRRKPQTHNCASIEAYGYWAKEGKSDIDSSLDKTEYVLNIRCLWYIAMLITKNAHPKVSTFGVVLGKYMLMMSICLKALSHFPHLTI